MEDNINISESIESLIREMGNVQREQGAVCGVLELDEGLLRTLRSLNQSEVIDGIVHVDSVDKDVEDLSSDDFGKYVKVSVIESLARDYIHIYESLDDLISVSSNKIQIPERFYLIDTNFRHPHDPPVGPVKHYFDLVKFLRMLKERADHVNGFAEEVDALVFLHKCRFDLQIVYASGDLTDSLDGISIVLGELCGEEHFEQKNSILKEVLIGMLADRQEDDRLSFLIGNFGEFSRRFNENYQFFVSEFSFDTVRIEYEEKKREYLIKLNDVFATAQTRMLGVPVSLAVSAFKMSPLVGAATFWTNTLLLLSVIAYSKMMAMLIKNQKHTIQSVKSEYDSHMTRLQHQFSGQYEKISQIKVDLDERFNFQNDCLSHFRLMSWALVFIVLFIFLFYLPWGAIVQHIESIHFGQFLSDIKQYVLESLRVLLNLYPW
ncbi:hypothetical protein [Microbulbifer sp. SAOS-129_SWC]|uniref:hypothetical protein n=1 Tax=Microbulbifer sp. SAOS-129_SWC TaxID=3145235 RepID=UPI0032175D83